MDGGRGDILKKIGADILVLLLQVLQDQQAGDLDEDLGVPALQRVLELRVLLGGGLQDVREVDQVDALLAVREVVLAFLPGRLVLLQQLHQVLVVFELRVYHF